MPGSGTVPSRVIARSRALTTVSTTDIPAPSVCWTEESSPPVAPNKAKDGLTLSEIPRSPNQYCVPAIAGNGLTKSTEY